MHTSVCALMCERVCLVNIPATAAFNISRVISCSCIFWMWFACFFRSDTSLGKGLLQDKQLEGHFSALGVVLQEVSDWRGLRGVRGCHTTPGQTTLPWNWTWVSHPQSGSLGVGAVYIKWKKHLSCYKVIFDQHPQEKGVDIWDQPWIETEDGTFHRHWYFRGFF